MFKTYVTAVNAGLLQLQPMRLHQASVCHSFVISSTPSQFVLSTSKYRSRMYQMRLL